MERPVRKTRRLQGWDYRSNGYYFVTICTSKRKKYLSEIVGRGLAPAESRLSPIGQIAVEQLAELEKRFPDCHIEKYVIMPNHIHAIIVIRHSSVTAGASPCPTNVGLSDMICAYKSLVTRQCKSFLSGKPLFQPSFYDHIIRDEQDYQRIWEYIETNPQRWSKDRFYE